MTVKVKYKTITCKKHNKSLVIPYVPGEYEKTFKLKLSCGCEMKVKIKVGDVTLYGEDGSWG